MDKDPVLHLKFTHLTDDNQALDSSGRGHHGTIHGAAQVVPDQTFGACLQLDGSDDCVQILAAEDFDFMSKDFSVEFWAKKQDDNTGYIFSQGVATEYQGIHIGFRDFNTFTFAFYGGAYDIGFSNDMEWHHWACVYYSDTKKHFIYRDGIKIGEGASSSPYQGSGYVFSVKAKQAGGMPMRLVGRS